MVLVGLKMSQQVGVCVCVCEYLQLKALVSNLNDDLWPVKKYIYIYIYNYKHQEFGYKEVEDHLLKHLQIHTHNGELGFSSIHITLKRLFPSFLPSELCPDRCRLLVPDPRPFCASTPPVAAMTVK